MLHNKLSKYTIILASGSPRRQQLFGELNVPFSVKLKEVEEIYPDHLQASEITEYLAALKSTAFGDLNSNELLITSDTIVWHDGEALGKPKSYDDAFSILQKLSDDSHEVFTSVCIRSKDMQHVFSDRTTVYFNRLTDEEIHFYLKEYAPFDKAGSYGIQDWIGLVGINKIEGSYFNVMGLPVHKLYKELMKL